MSGADSDISQTSGQGSSLVKSKTQAWRTDCIKYKAKAHQVSDVCNLVQPGFSCGPTCGICPVDDEDLLPDDGKVVVMQVVVDDACCMSHSDARQELVTVRSAMLPPGELQALHTRQ